MRRFFIPPEQIKGTDISLTGAEAHHIFSVLRLQPGRMIELFDGSGSVYQAEILTVQPKLTRAKIVSQDDSHLDDPYPLTLAQVVLKGKKMDVVVQKATELGVNTLIPVISRYCEGSKTGNDRISRWQRIVIEACKQSGRCVPMRIAPVTALEELPLASYRYSICCWEKEEKNLLLPTHLEQTGDILLLIGPEGGFHEQEITWVQANDFRIITLGPYVLRAETAALAAVSIVKYINSLVITGCP